MTPGGHYRQLVVYIHGNPQTHSFVADFRQWPYPSYHALVDSGATLIERQAVLALGGCQDWEAAPVEVEDLSGMRQDNR